MNRKEQYKRKFDFIIDKITNLPDEPIENEFYMDALFYRIQVSIDAVMDLVAMLCKDVGITVKDDYKNIDEIEKTHLFKKETINDLHRWNGLRNVLVHRYNKVEEDTILKNKPHIVKTLMDFIKKTEEFILDKFNNSR